MKQYFALFLLVVASLVLARPASAIPVPGPTIGTTTTLSSSPNSSVVGETVTFTVTVTGNGSIPSGFTPPLTGTVTFSDTFNGATTVLGSAGLSGSSATFSTSALVLGSHTVFATYSGDNRYFSSGSAPVTQIVKASGSTTTLSSSQNPAVVGQPVTLQANVTTSGTSPLVGSVSFFDGAALLGTVATTSNGVATLAVPALTVGSHSLAATYSGDSAIADSTASLTQVITKAQTTLALSSSRPGTAPHGANITFSATVKAVAPATAAPTGVVTFANGATVLGTGTIDGSGVATFTTSSLSSGKRTITASFGGGPTFTGSEATLTQTVGENVAAVTVVSAPSPSRFGEPVTITATVTTSAGAPNGSVKFKNGTVDLGSATLDASGVATFTTTALPLGNSTLVAEFDGAGFYPSGSGSIDHIVIKGDTTIALSSSPNPSLVGQEVTFTAAISSTLTSLTGKIEIFDNDRSVGTFDAQGTTGTFRTTALTAGTHAIRVVYQGNEQLNGSNAATITQQVNAPPPPSGASSSGSGTTSGSGGSSSSGTVTSVGGGDDDDDNGGSCAVTNAGASSASRVGLALLALAFGLVRRRRR